MLHTVSDVMNFQAVTGEDSFPVTEIFVDGQAGRIRFVAADIGSWFKSDHAIIGHGRFGIPDTRRRVWPVEISRDEIEAQPRWGDDSWSDWFADVTATPMLYAGPASMGYDPLLLEQISQRTEAGYCPDESDSPAEQPVKGLYRGSVLLGMTAKGHGEQLGHIGDLLFDASKMHVSHLVIDNGKLFEDCRYCIPFEQLRTVDEDASEAHLDLTLHSLTSAPKRTEMDNVEQSSEISLPGVYYHIGL